MLLQPGPVYAVCFSMKPVKAPLASHKQHNKYTTGNAHCQAQHINDGVPLMPGKISVGYFQVVSKHVELLNQLLK